MGKVGAECPEVKIGGTEDITNLSDPHEKQKTELKQKLPLKMQPDPPKSETSRPLKNAFIVLKYKKPVPQEKIPKATKKVNQSNQPKKNKNPNQVKTKTTPLKTTPITKPKMQQTITEMLQTSQEKSKTKELPVPPPPLMKPPTLLYRAKEETNPKPNLEPNQDVNQTKPNFDNKPVKPVTKPEPAQKLKPGKRAKATVFPMSDLKLFLEKKRKERELKQIMSSNVVITNPSPSVLRDNATLSRPPDSLLKNTPADSEIITERDQGSSALNGTTENMSGDLPLAQCNENLGEQPIV